MAFIEGDKIELVDRSIANFAASKVPERCSASFKSLQRQLGDPNATTQDDPKVSASWCLQYKGAFFDLYTRDDTSSKVDLDWGLHYSDEVLVEEFLVRLGIREKR